jgi:hypothetical protein
VRGERNRQQRRAEPGDAEDEGAAEGDRREEEQRPVLGEQADAQTGTEGFSE